MSLKDNHNKTESDFGYLYIPAYIEYQVKWTKLFHQLFPNN